MIIPEKNIDSVTTFSQTKEKKVEKLTAEQLADDIWSCLYFLQTQIQKEFVDIQQLIGFYSWYSKSMLLWQLNIEKRLENLWVFIKNFSKKYDYWIFKISDPEARDYISNLQNILDEEFQKLKENIYREIDQKFPS